MTTRLDRPLRREITVGEQAYTLTLDARGLKLVEKGKRKGRELEWAALVGGEAQPQSSVSDPPDSRADGSKPGE